VLASGELVLAAKRPMAAGKHTLGLAIKGANPAALKGYILGLDYLRLVPRSE